METPVVEGAQFPSPGEPPTTGGSRAAVIFIVVTVLLDFLAFGIIAPVLPDLIKQDQRCNR
jgi:DHA1 family tetracycline resistance protein-like MFS transporter